MTTRPNPFEQRFDLVKPLIEFGTLAHEEFDLDLGELIKIRASQINGCATCLKMHVTQARKNGESEDRIQMLNVWRDSDLYSTRERATLAWTEALTRVETEGAPEEAFETLKAHFNDEEQIAITLMIGAINAFNRVNIGLRVGFPEIARSKAA